MSIRREARRSRRRARRGTNADGRAAHIVLGVTLMIVGGLILLARLDLVEARPAIHLWPLAPIALGAAKLWQGWGTQEAVSGAWFVLVGLWFLAVNFRFLGMTMPGSWPLLLIATGLIIVGRSFFGASSAIASPEGPAGSAAEDPDRVLGRIEEVHDGR